jgi:hypothetical protein
LGRFRLVAVQLSSGRNAIVQIATVLAYQDHNGKILTEDIKAHVTKPVTALIDYRSVSGQDVVLHPVAFSQLLFCSQHLSTLQ